MNVRVRVLNVCVRARLCQNNCVNGTGRVRKHKRFLFKTSKSALKASQLLNYLATPFLCHIIKKLWLAFRQKQRQQQRLCYIIKADYCVVMAVCFARTWRGLVGVLVKCLAEAAAGIYQGTLHLLHMGSLQPGGCGKALSSCQPSEQMRIIAK